MPARLVVPRVTRTIQALLGKRSDGTEGQGLRARVPCARTFLDLVVTGDENRFAERHLHHPPPRR